MSAPAPHVVPTSIPEPSRTVDAVVVGAGFSGIDAVRQLAGLGLSVQAYEAGSDVGGTWYWNRYPGARCDCISLEYQFTFDKTIVDEYRPDERYPSQPVILQYLNDVADRVGVREHFRFNTRVVAAAYDEAENRWVVTTDDGENIACHYLVTAVGCLSAGQVPGFPGLSQYHGETYHTSRWPHEGVDFTGKRVAVIGTGSSGVQVIPEVAKQASHLTVFQRTPAFSLDYGPLPLSDTEYRTFVDNFEDYVHKSRTTPSGQHTETLTQSAMDDSPQVREATYEDRWNRHRAIDLIACYPDLFTNRDANDTISEFFRSKIRQKVTDPELAEKLSPRTYPLGAKRMTLNTDYFETYNRDNVDLVSLREEPLVTFTPHGIRTEGADYEVDAVVFATGFDAVTGPLLNIDITGRDGHRLADAWMDGPVTYLGLAVSGFPNLLTITGPGSPNVLTNVVCAIEQHVDWIADAIKQWRADGVEVVEADPQAQQEWTRTCAELATHTLYPEGNSWYTGANIPGKPPVMMSYVGGLDQYRVICDEVAADGYRGFVLTRDPEGAVDLTEAEQRTGVS
ncbi:MAG: flavin-containing monooxygenase [Actinomycetales bacterium]